MNAPATHKPTTLRKGVLLLLGAVLAFAVPAAARADQMDLKLIQEMPTVLEKLKKHGYKNVGVLRFSVKQYGQKAAYKTPLSGSLATRLENLLVLNAGDEAKTRLGVIHDASSTARKEKIGAWASNPTEQSKLFKLNYPLAWGTQSVKPDAFLTGTVELSKGLKKTTLKLELISKTAPTKRLNIALFSFDTDRQVVRDLGYSFALSTQTRSRLIKTRAVARDADKFILDEVPNVIVPNDDKKNPPDDKKDPDKKDPPPEKKDPPANDTQAKPDNIGKVSVELLADDTAADIRESATTGDAVKWQVNSPKVGQKIAFRLKNNSDKRLAVVLRINGVNTINEQTDVPENCGKHVLDKGETRVVKGFLVIEEKGDKPPEGKVPLQVKPIKVLVGEEAAAKKEELGDKAGLIEVDVFEEGNGPPTETGTKVTLRGLAPSKAKTLRRDYNTLKKALLASARLKTKKEMVKRGTEVVSREVLVPDATAMTPDPAGATIVSFQKPQPVARIAIRVVADVMTPE